LCGGDAIRLIESFGADCPDGGDPGETGASAPLVGEVEPFAVADGFFDRLAGFEGEEGWVSDEDGCIGTLQHCDGVGCRGEEGGLVVGEFAEEDFGVGEGTARSGVGCDGADGAEGVRMLDDELDGADFVEGGDGAAGDDGEVFGE